MITKWSNQNRRGTRMMDIEDLTDEELKQEYEIVRRELERRNIEQGLPVLWNY